LIAILPRSGIFVLVNFLFSLLWVRTRRAIREDAALRIMR